MEPEVIFNPCVNQTSAPIQTSGSTSQTWSQTSAPIQITGLLTNSLKRVETDTVGSVDTLAMSSYSSNSGVTSAWKAPIPPAQSSADSYYAAPDLAAEKPHTGNDCQLAHASSVARESPAVSKPPVPARLEVLQNVHAHVFNEKAEVETLKARLLSAEESECQAIARAKYVQRERDDIIQRSLQQSRDSRKAEEYSKELEDLLLGEIGELQACVADLRFKQEFRSTSQKARDRWRNEMSEWQGSMTDMQLEHQTLEDFAAKASRDLENERQRHKEKSRNWVQEFQSVIREKELVNIEKEDKLRRAENAAEELRNDVVFVVRSKEVCQDIIQDLQDETSSLKRECEALRQMDKLDKDNTFRSAEKMEQQSHQKMSELQEETQSLKHELRALHEFQEEEKNGDFCPARNLEDATQTIYDLQRMLLHFEEKETLDAAKAKEERSWEEEACRELEESAKQLESSAKQLEHVHVLEESISTLQDQLAQSESAKLSTHALLASETEQAHHAVHEAKLESAQLEARLAAEEKHAQEAARQIQCDFELILKVALKECAMETAQQAQSETVQLEQRLTAEERHAQEAARQIHSESAQLEQLRAAEMKYQRCVSAEERHAHEAERKIHSESAQLEQLRDDVLEMKYKVHVAAEEQHAQEETQKQLLEAEDVVPEVSLSSPQRKDSPCASSVFSPTGSTGRLSPIKLRTSLVAATPPASAVAPARIGETAQEKLQMEIQVVPGLDLSRTTSDGGSLEQSLKEENVYSQQLGEAHEKLEQWRSQLEQTVKNSGQEVRDTSSSSSSSSSLTPVQQPVVPTLPKNPAATTSPNSSTRETCTTAESPESVPSLVMPHEKITVKAPPNSSSPIVATPFCSAQTPSTRAWYMGTPLPVHSPRTASRLPLSRPKASPSLPSSAYPPSLNSMTPNFPSTIYAPSDCKSETTCTTGASTDPLAVTLSSPVKKHFVCRTPSQESPVKKHFVCRTPSQESPVKRHVVCRTPSQDVSGIKTCANVPVIETSVMENISPRARSPCSNKRGLHAGLENQMKEVLQRAAVFRAAGQSRHHSGLEKSREIGKLQSQLRQAFDLASRFNSSQDSECHRLMNEIENELKFLAAEIHRLHGLPMALPSPRTGGRSGFEFCSPPRSSVAHNDHACPVEILTVEDQLPLPQPLQHRTGLYTSFVPAYPPGISTQQASPVFRGHGGSHSPAAKPRNQVYVNSIGMPVTSPRPPPPSSPRRMTSFGTNAVLRQASASPCRR